MRHCQLARTPRCSRLNAILPFTLYWLLIRHGQMNIRENHEYNIRNTRLFDH